MELLFKDGKFFVKEVIEQENEITVDGIDSFIASTEEEIATVLKQIDEKRDVIKKLEEIKLNILNYKF